MLSGSALSLSLAGLRAEPDAPWGEGPRAAIEWVARIGYGSIQLDAAMAGLRARELDRSARRGIASRLRGLELGLSGLDLWIPVEHFTDPAGQSRAMDAAEAAIVLAADLRGAGFSPSLSLTLPPKAPAVRELATVAERHGVMIADYGSPTAEQGSVGVGVDPAEILSRGADVAAHVALAGRSLVAARLSDSDGKNRTAAGRGRLDLLAYGAALSVAGYERPVIVDLRGLERQSDGAVNARSVWPPM